MAHTLEAIARGWHARSLPTWTERHAKDALDSLEAYVSHSGPASNQRNYRPDGARRAAVNRSKARFGDGSPGEAACICRVRLRDRVSVGDTDPAAIVRGAMAPMSKGLQPAVADLEGAERCWPPLRLYRRIRRPSSPTACSRSQWFDLAGFGLRAGRNSKARRRGTAVARARRAREMKREHLVPLSHQAVEMLTGVRPLKGRCLLVFPQHPPLPPASV